MSIDRGVVTQHAGADVHEAVTFSHHGVRLMTITPEGVLVLGEGLAPDAATRRIAAMLVEAFGRCYGQALREADDRTSEARSSAKQFKAQLATAQARAVKAEQQRDAANHVTKELEAQVKRLLAKEGELISQALREAGSIGKWA